MSKGEGEEKDVQCRWIQRSQNLLGRAEAKQEAVCMSPCCAGHQAWCTSSSLHGRGLCTFEEQYKTRTMEKSKLDYKAAWLWCLTSKQTVWCPIRADLVGTKRPESTYKSPRKQEGLEFLLWASLGQTLYELLRDGIKKESHCTFRVCPPI